MPSRLPDGLRGVQTGEALGVLIAGAVDRAPESVRAGVASGITLLPSCGGCGRPCGNEVERRRSWRALYGVVLAPDGAKVVRIYACSGECLAATVLRLDADRWPIGTHEQPWRGDGSKAPQEGGGNGEVK